jgi:2-methylfumaryl-CoA isomerase
VLWSPFRRFTDLVGEGLSELRANPMMDEVDQPGIGSHLAPGSPLALAGHPRSPVERAPRLGEHTDEVLTEVLDLTPGELALLHTQGVVEGPDDHHDPRVSTSPDRPRRR